MTDFNAQYGLGDIGRSTIGNIDLDRRVPLYEQGLDGHAKTEESRTVAIDEKGVILPDGSEPKGHSLYVNIPTVINGVKYSDADADMHYMLTGKHLGQYDAGVQAAVDGARKVHIRQMNDKQQGLVPSSATKAELDFILGN